MKRRELLMSGGSAAAWSALAAAGFSVPETGRVQGKAVIAGANADRWGRPITPGSGGIGTKISSNDTGYAWAAFESHVLPSSGVPLHVHPHQEEWFYVLDGKFVFEIGGDQQRLTTGMSILGPRQVPHRFKNVNQAIGKLLIIAQPAGLLEQAFQAIAQLPTEKRHDPQTLKKILQQYDIDVIGPPLP